jgi:hypothetical protein
MDNSATKKLLDEFRQIAKRESSDDAADGTTAALAAKLVNAVSGQSGATARAASEKATGVTWSSVVEAAVSSSAASSAANAQGGSGGATSALKSVLKNGFGLAPLITSIIGLFRGSDSAEPAPALLKYAMPPSMNIERAEGDWGLSGVDYDQMGMPRAYGGEYGATPPGNAGAGVSDRTERSGAAASVPQITVNVQAMDARSFLDRSADIAAAVRNAMLHLNSVNDVVSDL